MVEEYPIGCNEIKENARGNGHFLNVLERRLHTLSIVTDQHYLITRRAKGGLKYGL